MSKMYLHTYAYTDWGAYTFRVESIILSSCIDFNYEEANATEWRHVMEILSTSLAHCEGNICLRWREHFQSDLDIFRFDSMFVKTRDLSPMFRFDVQTDMRVLSQQLFTINFLPYLLSGDRSCWNKNLMSVCTLAQKDGYVGQQF